MVIIISPVFMCCESFLLLSAKTNFVAKARIEYLSNKHVQLLVAF